MMRAFGITAAVLVIGWPLAVLASVAGFLVADEWTNRRYRRNPNGPRGLFLETDEVIWKDET